MGVPSLHAGLCEEGDFLYARSAQVRVCRHYTSYRDTQGGTRRNADGMPLSPVRALLTTHTAQPTLAVRWPPICKPCPMFIRRERP